MSLCYEMTYENIDKQPRVYYGIMKVRRNKTRKQAEKTRLKWHLDRPVESTANGVRHTFHLKAIGRCKSERNCLLQEALYTAVALAHDPTVRGGPFACVSLYKSLTSAAASVRRVVKGLQGQAARDALSVHIKTLHPSHVLARHVEGDLGSKKKTRAQIPASFVVLPTAFRRRASGAIGSEARKKKIRRGDYEKGDRLERRAHWGQNPSECIAGCNERSRK